MQKQKVVVGLIKGRHELPVDMYIFEEAIQNVHDYEEISSHIARFIEREVGVERRFAQPLNSCDVTDVQCFSGKKTLVVYVTGLTPVTAELIKCCALNGISLELMNFDTATQRYQKQIIF